MTSVRSLIRNLFNRKRRPVRQARTWCPLSVEALEERTVLTAAVVWPGTNPVPVPVGPPPALVSAIAVDNTHVQLEFNRKLGRYRTLPSSYEIPGLDVINAAISNRRRIVTLTTSSQDDIDYTLALHNVLTKGGSSLLVSPANATFQGIGIPDTTMPRMTGAVSTGNTSVLVSFDEPMADSVLNPAHYFIVQQNVNSEVGAVAVLSAAFASNDHRSVMLTTASQNEVVYTVTAVNVTDLAGNPMAPEYISGVERIDPSKAPFPGTPGSGTQLVDSDADGLSDAVEARGYLVTVTLVNGSQVTRQVTSDPFAPDTDADGLRDDREMALSLDPRNVDTDADTLTDLFEVDTLHSNASSQDSDGDGIDDASEFAAGGSVAVTTPTTTTDTTEPRVVGAVSLSNTTVRITFSEPMADAAANTANFFIAQLNVNPEVGFVPLLAATFVTDSNNRAIDLTTASQNEVTYTITAVNVTDRAGNALAPRMVVAGAVVDPTTATFPGTPPSGTQLVDTDGDGLADNIEQRGWTVSVTLLDGRVEERQVTSDPTNADSDGDGLNDAQERNLALDARNRDTDGDQLIDFAEFNEIFSDPTNQDTDGDRLDDFLEFGFFRTSPLFADTDGDQINDGDEILVSIRNPRIADLPTPDLEIGNINLQLDVRFTETTATGRRELESKSVSSSLQQSNRTEFSHTDSATQETSMRFGFEQKVSYDTGILGGFGVEFGFSQEFGFTNSFTTSSTSASAQETQRAYQDSLTTDVETTENGEIVREVNGAQIQVALTLKSVGSIAFRIQNLLVTAFIQDPSNPTVLRPIASLRPDFEPSDGFAIGPLVPEHGPIVFSSDTVFPALVESLMQNPRGVIFRLANYDIVDELDRSFAFTSQEIVERTGAVVFDFGSQDTDGDGAGDRTEYHRVATGTGRAINGKRVAFDSNGKPVGITLADAMATIGLTRYEARLDSATLTVREFEPGGTVPVTLTPEQRRSSYSTIQDASGVDRLFRIREVANQRGQVWVVLRPSGEVDASVGFNDKILNAGADIRLAYIQDLDGDNLPASLEYQLGTVDSAVDVKNNATWAAGADGIPDSRDTDQDGLDDRLEGLVGWTVDLGNGITRRVKSSGSLQDTDDDGLADGFEAPALSAFVDDNGDGLLDRYDPMLRAAGDFVTDPANPDTDGDGVARHIVIDPASQQPRPSDDFAEINGYTIHLVIVDSTISGITSDPTRADTDGDGIADGVEVRSGLLPNIAASTDSDRDGLADQFETLSLPILLFGVSTQARLEGPFSIVDVTSNPFDPDSDDDGLSDFVEFKLRTHPRLADTDGDGLTDAQEVLGVQIRDLGLVKLDPLDADIDDDLRSDGDEAELIDIESRRWIVAPAGKTPYRVFSDPRFADNDFDGVVDGVEYADLDRDGVLDPGSYRTDPNNANTDGDRRDDGVEYADMTNPLMEDFLVTVYFNNLLINDDGDWDPGDKDGDFGFDFGVRLLGTGPGGLGSYTSVVKDTVSLTNPFQVQLALGTQTVEQALPAHVGSGDPLALEQNFQSRGIAFEGNGGGTTLRFARYLAPGSRSITFGMTANQSFSVEGVVAELDLIGGAAVNSANPADYHVYYAYLGGVDGLRATQDGVSSGGSGTPPPSIRPVFRGSDLMAQASAFLDYTIAFKGTDNLQAGTGQGDGDVIGGSMSFSIFIS